jgi:glycerophosphoryl diester phosphodiesterase
MRRLSVPLLLLGVLLGLFAAPTVAAAEETTLSPACGVLVAHRGEHSQWTENTLNAMKAAAEVGAEYVEVDVRQTKGSGLILMHDRTIDRTTTSYGRVAEISLRKLRKVVLNDGTRITSLRRNLEAVKGTSIKVMLELKAIRTELGFTKLARIINDFGVDRVVVTSFKPALLAAVHAVEPRVRRSLVTARTPTMEQAVEYGSVSPHHSSITEEWLLQMRAGGFPVYAWTVNAEPDWARWNGYVDAITTDEAVGFAEWRKSADCPSVL